MELVPFRRRCHRLEADEVLVKREESRQLQAVTVEQVLWQVET